LIGSTKEQAAFLVDALNLKHLLEKQVKELSGGDKRVLSIAIAIMGNP
jgi:ABC-type multidrug transport system ATPase subunit